MISLLKKIYAKINFHVATNPYDERMSLDEQKAYIQNFDHPKDDFERCYDKYRCWAEYGYHNNRGLLFLFNIGAMLILPYVTAKLKKNRDRFPEEDPVDAVIENVSRLPNNDVIPEEIKSEYPNSVEITQMNYLDGILGPEAERMIKELRKRYFIRFYFRLICTLKIAQFDSYIVRYKPKAIVFYSYEREFTGPLQTCLCERQNCKFLTFMHGDYLYSIAFAFQHYSMFYIWDDEYAKMFKELRCEFQTKVYVPDKLKGIAENIDIHECDFYGTYYFSNETRDCAEQIRKAFDHFRERGLICKIRPHPRYSDIDMLKEVFDGYMIEEPGEWTLERSITTSYYTIGLSTTVLSQAYFSGKKVVIDDVSKPGEYDVLKQKGYIMIKRPHILLSRLIASDDQYDSSYAFFKREDSLPDQ